MTKTATAAAISAESNPKTAVASPIILTSSSTCILRYSTNAVERSIRARSRSSRADIADDYPTRAVLCRVVDQHESPSIGQTTVGVALDQLLSSHRIAHKSHRVQG